MKKSIASWLLIVILLRLTVFKTISCAAIDESGDYVSQTRSKRTTGSLSIGNPCITLQNEPGICEGLMSCSVYMQGLRSRTIKYNSIYRCGFIGFEEVVCCPHTQVRVETTEAIPTKDPITRAPPLTMRPTPRAQLFNPIPQERSQNTNLFANRLPKPEKALERPSQTACRKWKNLNLDSTSANSQIMGRQVAEQGEYPHMGVLIKLTEKGALAEPDFFYGSSLIAERFAITAAHCMSSPEWVPTHVRFGVVALASEEYDDYKILETIMHPDYVPNVSYHDIAILKLERVVFTFYTRPACLFSSNADIDSSTQLVVIGWNNTNVDNTNLVMGKVTTIPKDECQKEYNRIGVKRSYKNGIQDGQYCAITALGTNNACNIDTGGPLQLVENGESTVVGVLSFGLTCNSKHYPVYSRVGSYLDWIEREVWE